MNYSETKVDNHYIGYNSFIGRTPQYDSNGKLKNGLEALRIGTSDKQGPSFTLVEYNSYFFTFSFLLLLVLLTLCFRFIEQNGEIEMISSKSYNNTFRYNLFLRSQGGLTLRHAEYNQGT